MDKIDHTITEPIFLEIQSLSDDRGLLVPFTDIIDDELELPDADYSTLIEGCGYFHRFRGTVLDPESFFENFFQASIIFLEMRRKNLSNLSHWSEVCTTKLQKIP